MEAFLKLSNTPWAQLGALFLLFCLIAAVFWALIWVIRRLLKRDEARTETGKERFQAFTELSSTATEAIKSQTEAAKETRQSLDAVNQTLGEMKAIITGLQTQLTIMSAQRGSGSDQS